MGSLRRRGLPRDVFTSLRALGEHAPTVLAWGTTDDGYAVALVDRLVWSGNDEWMQVAWDEIEWGGWNGSDNQFRWVTVAGGEQELSLSDPGRLPAIFRERVEATIVLRREYTPEGTSRSVMIAARRGLGPNSAIAWRWTATGAGLTALAVGQVEREMQRLASEYDV